MLFRAGVLSAVLIASVSEAALKCYDEDPDSESWLLGESCDDIEALNSLLVSCGGGDSTTVTCKAGFIDDAHLVQSATSGTGCKGTGLMKKAYAAWDYGKNGDSKVQCDTSFPFLYFASPTICKAQLPKLTAAVAAHVDGEFPCELTTATSTQTTSATTSYTTTATTSGSSSATTSISSTASTTPTTISTSATSTVTTSLSSSATTTFTSTITTDNVLGPLECVTYKEGAPSEQKYLLQPKAGYTCLVIARTLSGLLDRCDAIGLYEGDAVVGDVIACNQLPGFPYPNFIADMVVKKATKKTKCIFLPFLLQEMLKAHAANVNGDANVNAMFAADNFRCDETNGNWLVADKDKCDSMAGMLGDALKDYREGRFDNCAYSTQTTTATTTASLSGTTTQTTTATTQSTSFTSSATTTLSSTATTSASTTAVTTVFRHVMSSCADGVTKGRLYANPDKECADTAKLLNEVLGECDDNAVFGQNPNLKETFECHSTGSHVALLKVTNCDKVVADLNAMVSAFRKKGRNTHIDDDKDAIFSCQNPFGFVRTTCSTLDEVDLNTVIDSWDEGRFRNCEYSTQTSTASSSVTSTHTSSATTSASTSATTSATSTGTTITPGRLSCGKSDQGIITVFFIAGPAEYVSTRQSEILDKLLAVCDDFLGQKKYADTMDFQGSGSMEIMYSKGTNGGSCSDTADRLNAMIKEYRRRGKYHKGAEGTISCDNGNRFYFSSESNCGTDLADINEMIERWGLFEFHECHLSTATSTATSSLSTTATSTQSVTKVTTVTTTATSSLTSTASSSVTTTGTSSVTTSGTSSATSSATSTATTSASSTGMTSASSTGMTTVTSTATSSVSSTVTSSGSTTATSTGSSTVTSSATSTVTSSQTTSVTSTQTTSGTSSATSSATSTVSTSVTSSATSTDSFTVSSTVTSSATSTGSTSVTSSGTSTVTSTITSSDTSTASSTATTSQSSTATSSVSSTVTSTVTTTASSSVTSTATASATSTASSTVSSSATSSATSTGSTTGTSSVTSTASSSATSSVTSSQTTSGTSSVTSSATSTGSTSVTSSATSTGSSTITSSDTSTASSTVTTSQSSTVSTSVSSTLTSTVTATASSSVTSTVTTSATSTASSTVSSSVTSSATSTGSTTGTSSVTSTATSTQSVTKVTTVTTTATSSLTSTASSSVTTTGTSSVTTSGTSSATSSATSTGMTSASSTGMTSASSTGMTTVTSTATSSGSTTATSTGSSTVTSSATSTVTSSQTTSVTTGFFAKLICATDDANFVGVDGEVQCHEQKDRLNNILSECSKWSDKYIADPIACNKQGGAWLLGGASQPACTSAAKALKHAVREITKFPGREFDFTCSLNSMEVKANDEGNCTDFVKVLNEVIDNRGNNMFDWCSITTHTSTGSSTVTTSQSSTVTSSATSTVSSTVSSSVTTSATTSRTTSQTSTATTSASSTITSTLSHTQKTTVTSTATSTISSSASTSITSSATSTATSTASTSATSTATSSVTSSASSTGTTSQTSSATTSRTSTVTSSASTTGTSTDSSTVTSTDSHTATSTFTTTATSSRTSTVTSTATTSASSSATSSATTSLSSTRTSTGTSTQTTTATSSQSNSGTSSQTTTASTSVTSTATNTATTATSTVSSTQTSTFFGKMTCFPSSEGGEGLGVHGIEECADQAKGLNELLAQCTKHQLAYRAERVVCRDIGNGDYILGAATADNCNNITTALLAVTAEVTQFPGVAYAATCGAANNDILVAAAGTVNCTGFAAALNYFIELRTNDAYFNCEVTSPTTTQTSTASSSATTTATSSASTSMTMSATTSQTSTATSTITTNNELTTVPMFFIGDANEVDGAAFDRGLRAAAVNVGVPEEEIHSSRVYAGSIVADMTVTGVEFGRTLDEAIAAGKLLVLVNGVAFVAYGNYTDVDPYALAGPCNGHHVGNVSFPLGSVPLAVQLSGFEKRNLTHVLPSELYEFESTLVDSFKKPLDVQVNTQDMELCVVSHIYYGVGASINSEIFLSDATADYEAVVADLSALQSAANSLAQGYLSGNFALDFRGVSLQATGLELALVDSAVLNPIPAEETNYTAGLIGAVVGVFVLSALLLGFIYRAKLITEAEHKKRVSMAIGGGKGIWRDKDGISSAQERVSFSARQISDFAFQFDMPANGSPQSPYSPYLETGGKRRSLESVGSAKPIPQYRAAESLSPAGRAPDYKALDAYKIAPDVLSQGYFSVGEINSPDSLPGPAANHFYPSLGGSSVFMQNITSGFGNKARGAPQRSSVASYTSGPTAQRPSLAADDSVAHAEFSSALRTLANYTDPSMAPVTANDTEWGSAAWRGALPGDDHDFPTLKAATIKQSRPALEPGYATPNESDIGVVEPVAVHYAAQRDSAGTPRSMIETLVSARPTLSDVAESGTAARNEMAKRPSLLDDHEETTFGFDEEDAELEDAFTEKGAAFDAPRASFIQGMVNIEKISSNQLLTDANIIAEEPEPTDQQCTYLGDCTCPDCR